MLPLRIFSFLLTATLFVACTSSTPNSTADSSDTSPSAVQVSETLPPATTSSSTDESEDPTTVSKTSQETTDPVSAPPTQADETPKAKTVSEKTATKANKQKAVQVNEQKEALTSEVEEVAPVEAPKKEKVKESAPSTTIEKPSTTVANTSTPATTVSQPEPVKEVVKPVALHDEWDQMLRQYVSSSGKVNYNGFKASEAQLDQYLDKLSSNPIQSSWSRQKKMAYWINAYNAFTIKLILKNYPVKSITDLHGGKPWDVKWIKLGNKTYTLNNIENDILRPQYKDARIHFAVNCAAKSCPPILNRAWTADNLERNLEKQAKKFVNDKSFNAISSKKIEISKIFEWYSGDFGDIVVYLNKYSNVKIDKGAKVSYKEYNWQLNK